MSYKLIKLDTTNPLELQPRNRCVARRGAAICHVSTVALAITFGVGSLQAAEFIPIGDTSESIVQAVSDDGSIVAGYESHASQFPDREVFRWTDDTGIVRLGFLPGDGHSWMGVWTSGMSGDGSTIVGDSREGGGNVNIGNPAHAFMYTESDGMRGLGDLPGGGSFAAATSFDGGVIVGGHRGGTNSSEAFRWTESEGMVRLGLLPGDATSSAADVSADGSIIVGRSSDDLGQHKMFIWTAATGMQGISPGTIMRNATVSADGSVVGGDRLITSQSDPEAFLWTEDTGVTGLGWLPGTAGGASAVRGISDNGAVVVGWSGATRNNRRGFIWTEEAGMQDLKQVLTDQYGLGASLEGWTLRAPQDISANGQYIVGNGYNPNGQKVGWLVRLDTQVPEPGSLALFSIGALSLLLHRGGAER